MKRLAAALAGRYRVDRELGAGGMATVYLATDLKHERDVAIKVLHPDLGAALGSDRFLSEIKTTAKLQHPHILPLLDSGEADGLLYYVMPLVTGETLRARLERERQLPIGEAVRIAREVASALDYAHRQGVIHRDIKPENILLHDGQALVADFGIALAVQTAGGQRMTQTGLSLGTPQYMSPEQAMGERAIDARSDVYALGAVMYEMLTGEPPFTGATVQAIVAKVLSAEAERPTLIRKTIPAAVEEAVLTALAKLPADRFATAAEFAQALMSPRSGSATGATSPVEGLAASRGVSRGLALGLAVAAIGASASAAWLAMRPIPVPIRAQFDVSLPDSAAWFSGGGTKIALSRDGSRLILVGVRNGRRGLFVRRLDDLIARPVPGSDELVGAAVRTSPAFSPEGGRVVYAVNGGLRVIPVVGGASRAIADTGADVSWGDGDVVVFARGASIWRVGADGRDARLVTAPDTARGIYRLKWPDVLPGGTHALVSIDRARQANIPDSLYLGLVSLTDGTLQELGVKGANPRWAGNGTIMFGRAGGAVMVAPFSLRSRSLTGPPAVLVERVWQGSGGATGFAVSWNGVLAIHGDDAESANRRVVIVDRAGTERTVATLPGSVSFPRLSPDGERLALSAGDGFDAGATLLEVATGAKQRLAAPGDGARPEWTRDGRRVLLLRTRGGKREIVSRTWDGSRADTVLASDTNNRYELAIGPPRGYGVIRVLNLTNDLYLAPMDSLGALRPLVVTSDGESAPAISPDGRWLAYASDESGENEIYLRPLPGEGPRVQVSVHGGWEPRWHPSGHAVYYRGPTRMMVAELGGEPLGVRRRDSLFVDGYERRANTNHRNWDLSLNGAEFLMIRARETEAVKVVTNWPAWRSATTTGKP